MTDQPMAEKYFTPLDPLGGLLGPLLLDEELELLLGLGNGNDGGGKGEEDDDDAEEILDFLADPLFGADAGKGGGEVKGLLCFLADTEEGREDGVDVDGLLLLLLEDRLELKEEEDGGGIT